MPSLKIPTPLRSYAAGQSEITLQGETIDAALQDLVTKYPTIQPHLFNGEGSLRPFVNLFLGEDNIKDLDGLATPLKANDRLLLIPSIAGG
jgi:adenylyltransferase/sulfurtransferase